MTTLVVVGAQWGDEGKGKVVDVLAAKAELVARFSGGNNAGHTLVVEGKKIITHLVPSGCAYPGTTCILGAGMVLDPEVFWEEISDLRAMGLLAKDELRVSLDAHVIFDFHRTLDGAREDAAAGTGKGIGTTRRGIGPAYEAKAGRRGIRVRDLFDASKLRALLELNREHVGAELQRLGQADAFDIEACLERAAEFRRWLEPMACDAGELVHAAASSGKSVLLEGAQGALLDVDHGTYPFVTSTSTTAGAAASGLGIGPTLIDRVWGITKAYTTRVGAGPFPTKLSGPEGDAIRNAGQEYGATTGRPRDCGWLDLPALRHSARVNGLTGLCVTKLDVVAALPSLKVCTSYADGVTPGRDGFEQAVPVLEDVPGFGDPSLAASVQAARTIDALPAAVRNYLDQITEYVGVPVRLISVGAGREQTVLVEDPF